MSIAMRLVKLTACMFAAAAVAQSAAAAQLPQTINFPAIATQTVAVPLHLSATASSGLPVSFTSASPGVCTVAGSSASLVAEGACFITANQAGNGTYAPAAPVLQAFSVYPPKTTTKPSVTSKIYSSSGGPQTLSFAVRVASIAPVNGGKVFISAEPFGTATTGVVTNGAATASVTLPANVPAGTFPITAVYLGTPQDFPSVGTTAFTVSGTAPPSTYTVGGTVAGLPSGSSLTLLDNGGNGLSVSVDGRFAFTTALATGAKYRVTISAQPNGEVCAIANGSGTVASANVTNVAVSCASTATTGTTAFSALSVGNARIAMVPLNLWNSASPHTGVAPIAIDGTTELTGSFVATSIPIQACSTDSANLIAVCIDYASAKVAVLDFTRFVSTFDIADIVETEFASGVPSSVTVFSGVDCVICGVVAVSSLRSFIVSAFDGYHVYAYPTAAAAAGSTLVPTSVYAVPIAENFTLSSVAKWLISPDYYVAGGQRALRLIDLAAKKAYTWTDFTDDCGTSGTAACQLFAAKYVDAAAFDESTKILVLNDELGDSQLTVDLSQAVFDAAAATFSAPSAFSNYSVPESEVNVEMSGILASSTGHWSFTIAEFGGAIVGVAKLPAAGGSGGSITLPPPDPIYLNLSSLTDYAPCARPPVGGEDPHAQGYTLSGAGVPLGLLVSGDSSCVAVIDFAVLAKAPTLPSPNGNVVDLGSYDPIRAGAITLYTVPAAAVAAARAN